MIRQVDPARGWQIGLGGRVKTQPGAPVVDCARVDKVPGKLIRSKAGVQVGRVKRIEPVQQVAKGVHFGDHAHTAAAKGALPLQMQGEETRVCRHAQMGDGRVVCIELAWHQALTHAPAAVVDPHPARGYRGD